MNPRIHSIASVFFGFMSLAAALAQDEGLRFLGEVIKAPTSADQEDGSHPDAIGFATIRTETGEEWTLYSWVMRDGKPEQYFCALQEGCLIGLHGVAWNEQPQELRSNFRSSNSVDDKATELWALSWTLHPDSPVPLLDDTSLRFLGEVIEAPTAPDQDGSPYPDAIGYARIRTESGEEWILHSWVMQDRKPQPFSALQKGCLIGIHGAAWSEQPQELRASYRTSTPEDYETPELWALSWTLHPDSEVPLVKGRPNQRRKMDRMRKILTARGAVLMRGEGDSHLFYCSSGEIYHHQFWTNLKRDGGSEVFGQHRAILEFQDALAAQGTELIVVILPRKESLIPGYVTRMPYDPEKDGRVNTPVGAFTALLQESGVNVIDMTPRFLLERDYEFEGEEFSLYETGGTHWSSYAAKLTAEAITQQFVEMGDVEFLATEEEIRARLIPPEVVPEAPGEQITGEMIAPAANDKQDGTVAFRVRPRPQVVNEKNHEVFLIGDSFTDYPANSSESLSDHLDARLAAPISTISAFGEAPTGVRSLWFGSPGREDAKVVVWAFAECCLGDAARWKSLPDPNSIGGTDMLSELPPSKTLQCEQMELSFSRVDYTALVFPSNVTDRRTDLGSARWNGLQRPLGEGSSIRFICGGASEMEDRVSLWETTAPVAEVYINGKLIAAERCPVFWTTNVHVPLPDDLPEVFDLEIRLRAEPQLFINHVGIAEILIVPGRSSDGGGEQG